MASFYHCFEIQDLKPASVLQPEAVLILSGMSKFFCVFWVLILFIYSCAIFAVFYKSGGLAAA